MDNKNSESIFYSGEELTFVKSVDVKNILNKVSNKKINPSLKSISVKEFRKGGETLWLLETGFHILAICRPPPNKPVRISNSIHKEIVENFGEFVEVANKKEFENIFEFFSSNDRKEEIFYLLESDYRAKSNKIEETIDLNKLCYLGRDSDGKLYLYDKSGKIIVYAYDHEINDNLLVPIDGQPEYTFYYSTVFSTVEDVAEKILNHE